MENAPIASGYRRIILLVTIAIASSSALQPALAEQAGRICRFEEHLGIIDDDPGPWVEIYDDGKVIVHRPAYMKEAGDHELHLSASELRRLRRKLENESVTSFDSNTVKKQIAEAKVQRRNQRRAAGTFFESISTDPATVVLRVSSNEGGQRSADKIIRWQGLNEDLKQNPELEPLHDLGEGVSELRALMSDHRLRKNQ